MSEQLYNELAEFFDTRPGAIKATGSLKKGTVVGIKIVGDDNDYHMYVEKDKGVIKKGTGKDPDFTLKMPELALREILNLENDDIADYGITFFQQAIRPDEENRIKIKIHTGLFTLLRHGYLGLLTLGGKRVMGWFAKKGVKGLGQIKNLMKKLRNSA